MNRYSVLSVALATVAALAGVGVPTASAVPKPPVVSLPKPNIVHIMVDDLGWQDIASHKIDGKPIYETPHLDRFTKEGRRFTNNVIINQAIIIRLTGVL